MRACVAVAAVAALVVFSGGSADAQVACPAPDALCLGDPCVISSRTIAGVCDLDFGVRALVVGGGLTVPDGGWLTLRARTIAVPIGIDGRGIDGATISLIAADTVKQEALVDVSGTRTAGSITIVAGGDVTLAGKMRATGGSSAAGGSITVTAGGRIIGPGTMSHDIHGGRSFSAGVAIYHGAAGVNLIGHLITRSGFGGYGEFVSAAGPVSIGTDIRTRVATGTGATLVMQAGTDATVARGWSADGRTSGGTLVVSGATVTMPVHQGLHARGRAGPGGTVIVDGTTVLADEKLMADGTTSGGSVQVSGEHVTINRGLSASGRLSGGSVSVVAGTGGLVVQPLVEALGGGGAIGLQTSGDLLARGAFRVEPVGCIAVSAAGARDVSAATFDVAPVATCP